jgi:hypothetical protein
VDIARGELIEAELASVASLARTDWTGRATMSQKPGPRSP